ncbi:MAG: ribonuclease R [Alphaproteobacteria bacterium]
MSDKGRDAPFPTKQQVLDFIRDRTGPVGKREIARAFNIRGSDRTRLNDILRELRAEGELDRGRGRRYGEPGTLPKVGVIEITGLDRDGDPVARPTNWDRDDDPPAIYPALSRGEPAPAVGDRILARLSPAGDGTYVARTIKLLESAPQRVLGIFQMVNGQGRIIPTNRRVRTEFIVPPGQENGASTGDLVEGQPVGGRSFGMPEARVAEVIGAADGPRAPSLIAIHTNDIPVEFDPQAVAAADAAKPVSAKGRTDLRKVPLVTIDGADARDFDDAVWAEKDGDGWHLIVAIADVSWYVRAGKPLDRNAFNRGNSVYFPDRVVPMLPEALSNGLCSLVPNEDRGCLAVHMWVDAVGNLKRHEFVRGIMRSAARLTYEQVEAAWTGSPDDVAEPLLKDVITPLYGAFDALQGARIRRGTIDLELPERKVVIDRRGHVTAIEPVQRLDSHRLIEEFMIAANVAAAEALEKRNAPCMYRVHDRPSLEKMESLRETLAPLGIKVARGQVVKPHLFQRIVSQATGKPEMSVVSMAVLRSQAQAEYNPHNIGHFGLALRRYAHFTSPIRRYSDLLVHRSLIAACGLGDDGLTPEDGDRFPEMGKHISFTERRAIDAEREAVDRFTTLFLADQVGAEFAARVNGVHRAGLFVTLTETGADGLVPMSMIGDDRFDLDPLAQRIRGRGSGKVYSIGTSLTVRLEEANIHTGSMAFSVVSGGEKSGKKRRPPAKRGKNGKSRKSRKSRVNRQ